MQIALISVAPPYRGGISKHTSIMAEKLSQAHSVDLINYSRQYPEYLFPWESQYLDDKMDNLYYYMQYIKFGFGRTTRDSCRMIQNKQMSRDEAINHARKFDSEFPKRYLKGKTMEHYELWQLKQKKT